MKEQEMCFFADWDPELAADFVGGHEGLRLDAYLCPAGVWTIGYGHTAGVRKGMQISEAEAREMLCRDLRLYAAGLSSSVKVPLSRWQFIALLSLTFNVGVSAVKGSTLLRLLNSGSYDGAAEQFLRWVYAGGKKLPGLEIRRRAERALFLREV